jgi:hypothetical protein
LDVAALPAGLTHTGRPLAFVGLLAVRSIETVALPAEGHVGFFTLNVRNGLLVRALVGVGAVSGWLPTAGVVGSAFGFQTVPVKR